MLSQWTTPIPARSRRTTVGHLGVLLCLGWRWYYWRGIMSAARRRSTFARKTFGVRSLPDDFVLMRKRRWWWMQPVTYTNLRTTQRCGYVASCSSSPPSASLITRTNSVRSGQAFEWVAAGRPRALHGGLMNKYLKRSLAITAKSPLTSC